MTDTVPEETRRDLPEGHRETEFFNEHDGIYGRAPGEYLDVQEREEAEMARAKTEGRRPDFDNLPAVAGTPLVVRERLRETAQSMPAEINNDTEKVATLPVDRTTAAEAANRDTAYRDMVASEDRLRNTGTTETGPVQENPYPTVSADEILAATGGTETPIV
jgi:hypothetical protein